MIAPLYLNSLTRILKGTLRHFSERSRAQGGTCLSYYYPANLRGLMGCASIPANRNEPSGDFRSVPTPQWNAQWSEIVFGNNGFRVAPNMPGNGKAKKQPWCNAEKWDARLLPQFDNVQPVPSGRDRFPYCTKSAPKIWRLQNYGDENLHENHGKYGERDMLLGQQLCSSSSLAKL